MFVYSYRGVEVQKSNIGIQMQKSLCVRNMNPKCTSALQPRPCDLKVLENACPKVLQDVKKVSQILTDGISAGIATSANDPCHAIRVRKEICIDGPFSRCMMYRS